jgi:hypothetical protein
MRELKAKMQTRYDTLRASFIQKYEVESLLQAQKGRARPFETLDFPRGTSELRTALAARNDQLLPGTAAQRRGSTAGLGLAGG